MNSYRTENTNNVFYLKLDVICYHRRSIDSQKERMMDKCIIFFFFFWVGCNRRLLAHSSTFEMSTYPKSVYGYRKSTHCVWLSGCVAIATAHHTIHYIKLGMHSNVNRMRVIVCARTMTATISDHIPLAQFRSHQINNVRSILNLEFPSDSDFKWMYMRMC